MGVTQGPLIDVPEKQVISLPKTLSFLPDILQPQYNKIAAAWAIYLAFGVMRISNESPVLETHVNNELNKKVPVNSVLNAVSNNYDYGDSAEL